MRGPKITDQQRVDNFFKEATITPFEDIPTTLLTGVVKLRPGTEISPRVVFDCVPIYEIPGWKRGGNIKVDIPYPGIPFVVLSAKLGKEIKGVVKNKADLNKTEGKKRTFPNQVGLDISLSDKNVNVFISKDKLKITGAKRPGHLTEAYIFINRMLMALHRQGHAVFKEAPMVVKIEIEMNNMVFALGYSVRKDALIRCALAEGLSCPPEDDAVRITYPMGKMKKKGDEERQYTFRIHHTGSVVYSGDERGHMKESYDKFMAFITRNEAAIRFC